VCSSDLRNSRGGNKFESVVDKICETLGDVGFVSQDRVKLLDGNIGAFRVDGAVLIQNIADQHIQAQRLHVQFALGNPAIGQDVSDEGIEPLSGTLNPVK